MSRIEKRFERIINNPRQVKWDELSTIAKHYGLTVRNPSRGSHFIVYYSDDPENEMISVPVHNNETKAVYVKKIIALIKKMELGD